MNRKRRELFLQFTHDYLDKKLFRQQNNFGWPEKQWSVFVQASIAHAVERQKRKAEKNGRENVLPSVIGNLVLQSTINLPSHVLANVGSSKLLPKYIGFFRVLTLSRQRIHN